MRVIECEQMSPEWWTAKRGIPSASNFDRIITPKKGKLSAGAEKYINELIAEAVCQCPPVFSEKGRPPTKAMQDGIDNEPTARRWYEMHCKMDVQRVGFIINDAGNAGCSPDALVGEDGCLELKCPTLPVHIDYLRGKVLPDEYKPQVHGQLIVTGRKWVDFVSYSPPLPAFIVRTFPNEFTTELRVCLELFQMKYREALEEVGGFRDS